MADGGYLEALTKTLLHERLREVIDSGYWSLCVTLVSGDLLFGDFFAQHVPVDGPYDVVHVPNYWDEQTRSLGFAFRLEPFELIYNDEEGTVHGSASVVTVLSDRVARIDNAWWDITAETGFKNIPNPYASLIWRHNDDVERRNGLSTSEIAEFALATSHITKRGIRFSKQQLLYADYTYFGRLPSASLSVGGIGVGAGVTRGLETVVDSVLRGGATGRLHIPPALRRHVGFIEPLPEEIDTEIEGEQSFLLLLSLDENAPDRIPVLFKRSAVSYPRELWPHIKSKLVVIGERHEIPTSYRNETWLECVIARVIGYIP